MLPIPLPTSASFFFEIVLPGIIGVILAYPLLPPWARVETGPNAYLGFVGLALMIGLVPRLLLIPLVDFSMGRYWPSPLRDWTIRKLQARANAAVARARVMATPGFPSPRDFATRLRDQRLLDALVAEAGGQRVAYCPTLVGNVYASLVADLYRHFELEAIARQHPSPPWIAQAALSRVFFLLPKETRTELREAQSTGVGLLRIAVIATGIALVYLGHAVVAPSAWPRDLVLAAVMVVVGRVAYVAGAAELISSLVTMRGLFLAIDRDTMIGIREYLASQAGPLQAPSSPPQVPPTTKRRS